MSWFGDGGWVAHGGVGVGCWWCRVGGNVYIL